MIPFGTLIIEEGLVSRGKIKERNTIRAIIKNEQQQILMVYSNLFDDYTFPGGGIMDYETHEEALKRELKEEIGALEVEIIKAHGTTKEMRYGIKGSDNVYMQTSIYYDCVVHKFGAQDLQKREVIHGLEARWVSIDDAIEKNLVVMKDQRHQTKGLKTVLIRENMVLNKLKETDSCVNLKL